MKNIILKIVVLLVIFFVATDLKAQSFEMENLSLSGYQSYNFATASGGKFISLLTNFGSVKKTISSTEVGVKDLKVTYAHEGTGNSVFEVYVSGKLVDSWLSHDYFTVLSQGNPAIVTHSTSNVTLINGDVIEIVGYKSGTEMALLDKLDITTTVVPSTNFSLSASGTVTSLKINSKEYISGGSTMTLRNFSGSLINEYTLNGGTVSGDAVSLKDGVNYKYADYIFRAEKFQNHVRLKLIGLDKVPKNDNSFSLRVKIPYTSNLKYVVINEDQNVQVTNSSNVITINWTKLASRGLTPGGYIAFYPADVEQQALEEIKGTQLLSTIDLDSDLTLAMNIFPNPFTKSITILSSSQSISQVEIYTMLGQLVATKKETTNEMIFDLSFLNKGIYIMKITRGGKVLAKEIIKN